MIDRMRFSAPIRGGALAGLWIGSGADRHIEGRGKKLGFDAEMEFIKISRSIVARVRISTAVANEYATVMFTGGFYDEDLLQFTYRSESPEQKQMGVVVMRLSSDAKRLTGHYAGFSPTRGVFVSGYIRLARADQPKHKIKS